MSNRIAYWRTKRGWTQEELADEVKSTQPTIFRLERGESELTVKWMNRLAKALGVNPIDLLSTALVAEVQDDVEVHDKGTDPSIMAAIKARGLHTYRVLTNVVDTVGLVPGAVVVVDTTQATVQGLRCGNVVIARIKVKETGQTACVLRRFLYPNLLTTHRLAGRDVSLKLGDPDFEIEILGVVQRDSAH
jgi:transcriptional regulator with XRE-family HTH domain